MTQVFGNVRSAMDAVVELLPEDLGSQFRRCVTGAPLNSATIGCVTRCFADMAEWHYDKAGARATFIPGYAYELRREYDQLYLHIETPESSADLTIENADNARHGPVLLHSPPFRLSLDVLDKTVAAGSPADNWKQRARNRGWSDED